MAEEEAEEAGTRGVLVVVASSEAALDEAALLET